MRSSSSDRTQKRIPVDAVVTARLGEPMTVTLTDDEGNVGYGETDFIAEAARKRALDACSVCASSWTASVRPNIS